MPEGDVTFKIFEMRGILGYMGEPNFFMYGFCHEWGGYEMTDWQRRAFSRKHDRQVAFEIGEQLARDVRRGAKPPDWLQIT